MKDIQSITTSSAGLPASKVEPRRGAMLVFVAIAMVVLFSVLALTLNAGAASRQRRHAQTAADAGAIGGASEIFRAKYDSVTSASFAEAVRNGFPADDVTVNYPPASGTYVGNTKYVEVLVNRQMPTIFGSIFNSAYMNVSARGVAGVSATSFSCVYALDQSGSQALDIDGRLITNCGITVNSSSSSAIDIKSGARLTGSSVAVTGGVTGGGTITPAAKTGVAPAPNPLSSIQMPTVGACTYAAKLNVSGTQTLNPGVYCGGIEVSLAANKAILNPGTYIIAGGGLTVTRGAQIAGNGVTIILTNGPGNDAAAYQPFEFSNGCKASLSAPTTGALAGILLMQDPAAGTPGVEYINTFACSNDVPLSGTIYLPTQTAYFGGSNSDTEINGSLIAKKVEVKAGTDLTLNQPLTSGSAVKRLSLVQ